MCACGYALTLAARTRPYNTTHTNHTHTMMLKSLIVALILVAKFTDEQYTTINQSTAGHFDPRVFVNCLQV